jgi:hypothetical protein
MHEEFKDVVGFEDLFTVSNFGNVFSKRSNRILKQYKNANGYFVVATRIGGRKGVAKCFKVHRLVAEAFITNSCNKPCINHRDGVKTNNSVTNLEWVTHSENSLHAVKNKLTNYVKGELHPHSVLKQDDVELIRHLLKKSLGYRKIAKKLGLSVGAVSGVVYNRNWKH